MDGLTAKVFRTYNASITLQQQLKELTSRKSSSPCAYPWQWVWECTTCPKHTFELVWPEVGDMRAPECCRYVCSWSLVIRCKVYSNCRNNVNFLLQLVADENLPAKILSYNRANRAVAILCNHQRAQPKTFEKSMQNLQTKVRHWAGHTASLMALCWWHKKETKDCCFCLGCLWFVCRCLSAGCILFPWLFWEYLSLEYQSL